MDYREAIREMLIQAGTIGVKQQIFTHRLVQWAVAAQITEELEALRSLGKVQKFVDRGFGRQGKPATYWRATTKILERT